MGTTLTLPLPLRERKNKVARPAYPGLVPGDLRSPKLSVRPGHAYPAFVTMPEAPIREDSQPLLGAPVPPRTDGAHYARTIFLSEHDCIPPLYIP